MPCCLCAGTRCALPLVSVNVEYVSSISGHHFQPSGPGRQHLPNSTTCGPCAPVSTSRQDAPYAWGGVNKIEHDTSFFSWHTIVCFLFPTQAALTQLATSATVGTSSDPRASSPGKTTRIPSSSPFSPSPHPCPPATFPPSPSSSPVSASSPKSPAGATAATAAAAAAAAPLVAAATGALCVQLAHRVFKPGAGAALPEALYVAGACCLNS